MARLAILRPSLSHEQYLAALSGDMSVEAAEFLWGTVLFYIGPQLTPHPDDELGEDLLIDEDDWGMDWPRDFAEQHDFSEDAYADWPAGWRPTIRNYGRWLDMGLSSRNGCRN